MNKKFFSPFEVRDLENKVGIMRQCLGVYFKPININQIVSGKGACILDIN